MLLEQKGNNTEQTICPLHLSKRLQLSAELYDLTGTLCNIVSKDTKSVRQVFGKIGSRVNLIM